MSVKEADKVNHRLYLLIKIGTSYTVDPEFYDLLDTENEPRIPGYIASERFISGLDIIKLTDVYKLGADSGPAWKIVRTGMDNVKDQGREENQPELSLRGFHFSDLDKNEQLGIKSWCAFHNLNIDFEFVKEYPFHV
jgi:hypothetical protein